jgi:hypothetical protein
MDYPIVVEFDNGDGIAYRFDGRYNKNRLNPELFWDEIRFEIPKPPLPDLEVDTKVFVWVIDTVRYKRHFSHFDKEGNIVCFDDGKTSWTTEGCVASWENWELIEEDTK